jgi:hypothetical protein
MLSKTLQLFRWKKATIEQIIGDVAFNKEQKKLGIPEIHWGEKNAKLNEQNFYVKWFEFNENRPNSQIDSFLRI